MQFQRPVVLAWFALACVCLSQGINVNPTSIIGDIGETVTLTCDGAGLEDATHYYWTVNGSVLMCSGCSSDLNIPAILNGSLYLRSINGPMPTITINETNGGVYDCVAFNETDYAVDTGYLFVNPVVEDQQAENMSAVTFVCQTSFPSPDGSYQWIRNPPNALPEVLAETGRSLTVIAHVEDTGTVYTCVITANISGHSVILSDGGSLTVFAETVSPEGLVFVTPRSLVAVQDEHVRFRCITESGPAFKHTYQWLVNASHYLCGSSDCSQQQTYPDLNRLLEAVNNGDLDISVSTRQYLSISDVDASEHGGEYDCIVSNDFGIGRASAILYVEPHFTLHPADATANRGETVTFTCMAESFPYPTYQWQKRQGSEFVDIFNETDTTLTVDVSYESAGVYRCVAMTTILGTTISNASSVAVLQVSPAGSVSIIPESHTAAQNEDVRFHCTTGAGPEFANSYLWVINASHYLCDSSYCSQQQTYPDLNGLLEAVNNGDLDISISTSRNLDVTDVNATEHGGEYDCIVSNDAGIGRATTILYVEPYFTLHPMDVTAYHGETATFTCMAESFPYPAYQWQKRQGSMFVDLPDETGTTLTVDVSEDSSEVYRCVAMSLIIGSTFSVYSNEATLYGMEREIVSPEGLVSVIPDHLVAVQDEDVQFGCESGNVPDTRDSYLWVINASHYLCDSSDCSQQQTYPDLKSLVEAVNNGDLDISVSTSRNLDILDVDASEDGGEYDCIVSNEAGIGRATAILYIEPYFTLQPADAAVSEGASATLTCMAESFPYPTYKWQKLQGSMFVDVADETDTLTVHVGNDSCEVYRCVATTVILGSTSSIYSNKATVCACPEETVSPQGSVAVIPEHVTAAQHEDVRFRCVTGSGSDFCSSNTYLWLINASHYLCDSSDCSQQQIYSDLNSLLEAVNNGDLDISVSTSHYLDIVDVDATEDGGEYDCIVSNDLGIGRASSILYVKPYFTLHPVDATADIGETVTFTCMAQSFPSPVYQWQKQNRSVFVDIFNKTDTTLTIDVDYDSDGVYRCVAITTILGNTTSSASSEAVLQVSPEGSVSVIPPSHTAAQDDNVQFRCITPAGPEYTNTYQWLINASRYLCDSSDCGQQQTYQDLDSLLAAVNNGDLDISVSTSRILNIRGVDASEDGGEYDCIVRNDAGIGRATTILYVKPYFTLHPANKTANLGETVTFTCMAESFPYPAYQWQKQQGARFVDILNEADTALTINVGSDSHGVYRCVATNVILGTTFTNTSTPATLHVAPEASITVDPQDVMIGDTLLLTCTASGGPKNRFTWTFNGVAVGTGPVYTIASFAPEDYGTYACTVTNAAGSDTASTTISS